MTTANPTVIYMNGKKEFDITNTSKAAITIYNQFFLSLFNKIHAENSSLCFKMKIFTYDWLIQSPITLKTRDAFRNYLLGNRPLNLIEPIEQEIMQESIQFIYDRICDFFGPVKADAIMSAALMETQQLPEAAFYHPRDLL